RVPCCQRENRKFHKKFSPYGKSQFTNSQFARIAAYITKVARAPRNPSQPRDTRYFKSSRASVDRLASSIEYHPVLLLAPLLAQLKRNARFLVDLAHRN